MTLFAAVAIALPAVLTPLPAHAHHIDPPPFEFRFPQEPDVTEFGSTFGARRSGCRSHKGTDLMAPKMTEVYAAAPGIVTTVGTSSKAGRYVEIDHLGGWTTMYVHLNNDNIGTDDGAASWTLTVAPGVKEGFWVKAGQLIGWVGDSGNAEGKLPHTHFELAYEGTEIDAYDLLVGAHERAQEDLLAMNRPLSPDVMV